MVTMWSGGGRIPSISNMHWTLSSWQFGFHCATEATHCQLAIQQLQLWRRGYSILLFHEFLRFSTHRPIVNHILCGQIGLTTVSLVKLARLTILHLLILVECTQAVGAPLHAADFLLEKEIDCVHLIISDTV